MKPTVYLETTIISYLAARPSADLITAANQLITHDWWSKKRHEYQLYVSDFVIEEAKAGDVEASNRRMAYVRPLQVLYTNEAVLSLASDLAQSLKLPKRAEIDASHIASAAIHEVDYLCTWNCKHIANASLFSRIQALCEARGYAAPVICTPYQLLGEYHDVE